MKPQVFRKKGEALVGWGRGNPQTKETWAKKFEGLGFYF